MINPSVPDAIAKPVTKIMPWTFHDDPLEVVRLEDGDVGVTLRRLCEIVGINQDCR